MPFERVPDLVAGRRVLLRGGWAYVSRHEACASHMRSMIALDTSHVPSCWALSHNI